MNLTQTCSYLLLSKDILQIQIINANLNVVFDMNDYFSFKSKCWVVGQCKVWFGSLWSSALRAFSMCRSGTSDLCYFEVNLLLALVVRQVP